MAWYPTAGCIDYVSGSIIKNGSEGYYWSTSPYANVANYAYHLFFTNTGSVDAVSYYKCDRGDACSVRCVKE